MTVEEFLIKLTFDDAALKQSADKVTSVVDDLKGKITAGLGAFFSADYFKTLATNFASVGSSLTLFSQKTGESTEKLQQWQQLVKRTGGTAEGFNSTLNNVRNALQDVAVTGGGGIGGLFAGIGINARDSQGKLKSTTDIFLDLADKLSKMDVNKAQFIQRSLGIDDATFLQLRKGREALLGNLDTLKQYGIVSAAQAQQGLILKQRIDDLSQSWGFLQIQLGEKIVPLTKILIDNFIKFNNSVLPMMSKGFAELEKTTGLTSQRIGEFITAFAGITVAAAGIRVIIGALAALTTTLGPLIVALTALVGLYEAYKHMSFEKTNAAGITNKLFTPDAQNSLKQSWNHLKQGNFKGAWDALTNSQMMKESGGNPNAIGDNGRSFGLFQIQPATASAAWGRSVSSQELLNPAFNKTTRDLIMQKGLELSGGSTAGALAYYNGGLGGLHHWMSTGRSYNNYAESVMAASNAQNIQSQYTTESHQQATTINVDKLNLPSVRDSSGFASELAAYSHPYNLTRAQNNFQSGRKS